MVDSYKQLQFPMIRTTLKSCLLIIIILFWTSILKAAVEVSAENSEQNNPFELQITEDDFEYALEGRPDPFLPFITEKTTANEVPDEIIEVDEELTGMRRFEPGQLSLVAVMFSGAVKYAMVEDVTGKGYIIHEGTEIGKRGVVEAISDQQVLIKETSRTRSGKEIIDTVTMRLKKDGDK